MSAGLPSVPHLDDLVRLTEQMAPAESIRFVLAEAMGRLSILQARAVEFAALSDLVTTLQIGEYTCGTADDNGFGGDDQDVTCTIPTGLSVGKKQLVKVVLRLTPDCPLVQGSVYIDQMLVQGGDDSKATTDAAFETLTNDMNAKRFASPVELMQAVRTAIQEIDTNNTMEE
jgi:hypothetical protein